MHNFILKYRTVFSTKFGGCQMCMRQSFTAALAAWGGLGIGQLFWPNNMLLGIVGLLAFGLTILWTLHLAAYSLKTGFSPAKSDAVQFDRRHTLGLMLRAVGIGIAVSTPAILWPSKALAFCGQCTVNKDCGVGWSCKNTAAIGSGKVCNECVQN